MQFDLVFKSKRFHTYICDATSHVEIYEHSIDMHMVNMLRVAWPKFALQICVAKQKNIKTSSL